MQIETYDILETLSIAVTLQSTRAVNNVYDTQDKVLKDKESSDYFQAYRMKINIRLQFLAKSCQITKYNI